jgi:alpha-tubulin suppressor-like RCC1 family protein
MAITDKEQGVWELDQVYNKINQGSIWDYDGIQEFYIVGKNESGVLGQNIGGNPGHRSSPVQIPGTTWKYSLISPMNDGENGAIKTDGSLWTWGRNEKGELGQNNLTYLSSPTQVGTDGTWSNGTMRGRQEGGLVAKTDGSLWVWGINDYGSLGLNQNANAVKLSSPAQIPGSTWSTTTHTWNAPKYCTGNQTCITIKTDGTLWTWGNGNYGHLAQNIGVYAHRSSPVQVGTETTWSAVSGGQSISALKTDGSLWVWGDNSRGQLGLNQDSGQYAGSYAKSSPTQVGTETNYSQISTGKKGQWAIKTDGTLWGWGENGFGQLGQNQAQTPSNDYNRSSPVQVGSDTNWQQVSAGTDMTIALKTDGTFWSWGYNFAGSLGLGGAASRSSPTQVPGTDWNTGIRNTSNGWAAFKLL